MKIQTACRALGAFALLLGASSAIATVAPAPAALADSEGDVRVLVVVVDEVTGQPLGGWDIRIGPRGPEDFWFTGRTGNGGTATFLLPPGDYRAWVSRGTGPLVWNRAFSAADEPVVVVAVNPYEAF